MVKREWPLAKQFRILLVERRASMKLLVIGAGTVGQHLAENAAKLNPFTEIVVADRDMGRAQTVASLFGGSPKQLDATDHVALVGAMREADVAVSAIGPSTRFGMPTLLAAIEAGCPYAEIGDDPRPTLAMLECDAQAKASGVTAILGLGASPGVANMLAIEAGQRLDRVDRILTGWGSGGAHEATDTDPLTRDVTAALEHWVEQASGTIPVLMDGVITEAKPLSLVEVNYPGIGKVVTRTIGHPEPVTLKRRFPELQESFNVMDFPSYVFACLAKAAKSVDEGKSPKEGAELLIKLFGEQPDDRILSGKAASYFWHEAQDHLLGKRWLPPIWALASGLRHGKPARIAAALGGYIQGGMGPMTGIPAALMAAMLASGETIGGPGVHSVDTTIDPDLFFSRLLPYLVDAAGHPAKEALSIST